MSVIAEFPGLEPELVSIEHVATVGDLVRKVLFAVHADTAGRQYAVSYEGEDLNRRDKRPLAAVGLCGCDERVDVREVLSEARILELTLKARGVTRENAVETLFDMVAQGADCSEVGALLSTDWCTYEADSYFQAHLLAQADLGATSRVVELTYAWVAVFVMRDRWLRYDWRRGWRQFVWLPLVRGIVTNAGGDVCNMRRRLEVFRNAAASMPDSGDALPYQSAMCDTLAKGFLSLPLWVKQKLGCGIPYEVALSEIGAADVLRELIRHSPTLLKGKKTMFQCGPIDVPCRWSLLHSAVQAGRLATVQMLVEEFDMDVNAVISWDPEDLFYCTRYDDALSSLCTALELAEYYGHAEVARYLRAHGALATIDLEVADEMWFATTVDEGFHRDADAYTERMDMSTWKSARRQGRGRSGFSKMHKPILSVA